MHKFACLGLLVLFAAVDGTPAQVKAPAQPVLQPVVEAPAKDKDKDKAKDKEPVAAPKLPPIDPNLVEVRFADGSAVKMTMLQSSLEVVTRYGKLAVPCAEIRRIEFGLRYPDGYSKRIDEAVDNLGSTNFKQRDAATKELVTLGEYAIPAVTRATKATDPEVARRAADVLKLLMEKVPPERQKVKTQDTVTTGDFAIVGRIDSDILKAKTQYFGDVALKLSELRAMRWLAGAAETEFAIDAAKYAMQNEVWMDTGIELRHGSEVVIAAAGTIDLYPNSGQPGQFNSGPSGNKQYNNGRGVYPPG
jgi:hypothetical protein